MTTTKTITLYTFDELPTEAAKDKARAWFRECLDGTDVWEDIKEDAKTIGLTIISLHQHKANKGSFDTSAPEVAESIMREHGKECRTYKTTHDYLRELETLGDRPSDTDEDASDSNWEDAREELDNEFLRALLGDYYTMLDKEIEYQNSDEAVDENIRCNEYTFTEDGGREG